MSVAAVGNYENDDVLRMMAACIQTPGVGVTIMGQKTNLLGIPVLLWGAPGVGKTARIAEMARCLGYHFEPVLASIREASDFLGIPIPGGVVEIPTYNPATGQMEIVKKKALKFSPPDWALRLAANAGNDPFAPMNTPNGRRALLFLDEFSTALPDVQNALLRVVQERVVGDLQLPANVAVVAAANPPWMTPAGEGRLAPPTANRFVHLNWKPPSPTQWAHWFSGKTPKDGAMDACGGWPRMDYAEFRMEFNRLRMDVATWFDEGLGSGAGVRSVKGAGKGGAGGFLFEMPKADEIAQLEAKAMQDPLSFSADIFAWPSPRSWEIGMRARAGCLSINPVPRGEAGRIALADEVTCATVGSKACSAFNGFARGLGRTIVSAARLLSADPNVQKKAQAEFLKKVKGSGADFITASLDNLMAYMESGATEANVPHAIWVLQSIGSEGIQHVRVSNFDNLLRQGGDYLKSPQGEDQAKRDPQWRAAFAQFLRGAMDSKRTLDELLKQ